MEIHFKIYFFQCRVPSYGPFDTLNTKVLEKNNQRGSFYDTHPKYTTVHYSALQCTVVLTIELFTQDGSNMTHNDPG